jgi:3-hydroxyisobutyrate dehydrogenase-like beta-hydroxyacid dehydrogenase
MHSFTTVGILYPGELGAALGSLLEKNGIRVVTTLNGRSQHTVRLGRAAGLTVLDSLSDVVREADVVVSVVPPDAAATLADQYAELAALSPAGAIYVDVNSIGPKLVRSVGDRITAGGRSFVDASVRGPAGNLAAGATLYLSGARAGEIATLFEDAMRVRVLGREIGRASAMKMILTGIPKGISALFVEVAALALREGMLKEMNEELARFDPGVVSAVERMLPTYPRHAGRRVAEIAELEETCRGAGQEPCMFRAVRSIFEEFAAVDFDDDGGRWTVASIIEHLVNKDFLATDAAVAAAGVS